MSNLIDFLARVLISVLFLISAYNKIFNIEGSMNWMSGYGVPGILIYPTILLEILLPVMIIIGYKVRIAAGILSIFCLLTAFIFHFDFADQIQLILFLKNIGLAGGFLFIVVNGTKEWSLDKEKKFVRL
tara:strand:- start:2767 stop:3153 length:387 start_codon:yes stop_codon:yes gene_type:complete